MAGYAGRLVTHKKGPAVRPTLSVGGLNRTRNNRPGPSKPRGAGGLRNPVLFETGPEVTTGDYHTAQLGDALSEIGQQYDFINKSVIAGRPPECTRKPLPSLVSGAIMTLG